MIVFLSVVLLIVSGVFGHTVYAIDRTATAIGVGQHHTCAILDDGSVKCWGRNYYGQLGYDDVAQRGSVIGSMASLGSVNLGSGRTATALALGNGHTCALLDNNSVKCWGSNGYGQLGYDDTTNRGNTIGSMATVGAVNLGSGRTATAIAAGSVHTCAILDNGSVKCWGDNTYGQLGYDDTVNRGDTTGSMAILSSVNLGIGRTATAIAAGGSHTCAILDNNNVKCWG
ncbi:MAG: hypothetical protein RJB15_944, partial [Pseudomonadota bacterium]